jgi:hypothetical protein
MPVLRRSSPSSCSPAPPAAAADPLAEARRLYNQGDYGPAAQQAREALKVAGMTESARLILGRVSLELYRRSADHKDLIEARNALRSVDAGSLDAARTRGTARRHRRVPVPRGPLRGRVRIVRAGAGQLGGAGSHGPRPRPRLVGHVARSSGVVQAARHPQGNLPAHREPDGKGARQQSRHRRPPLTGSPPACGARAISTGPGTPPAPAGSPPCSGRTAARRCGPTSTCSCSRGSSPTAPSCSSRRIPAWPMPSCGPNGPLSRLPGRGNNACFRSRSLGAGDPRA